MDPYKPFGPPATQASPKTPTPRSASTMYKPFRLPRTMPPIAKPANQSPASSNKGNPQIQYHNGSPANPHPATPKRKTADRSTISMDAMDSEDDSPAQKKAKAEILRSHTVIGCHVDEPRVVIHAKLLEPNGLLIEAVKDEDTPMAIIRKWNELVLPGTDQVSIDKVKFKPEFTQYPSPSSLEKHLRENIRAERGLHNQDASLGGPVFEPAALLVGVHKKDSNIQVYAKIRKSSDSHRTLLFYLRKDDKEVKSSKFKFDLGSVRFSDILMQEKYRVGTEVEIKNLIKDQFEEVSNMTNRQSSAHNEIILGTEEGDEIIESDQLPQRILQDLKEYVDLNYTRDNDLSLLRLKFGAQEALIKTQAEEIVKKDETIRNLRAQIIHSQPSINPLSTPKNASFGITQIKDLQPADITNSPKGVQINGSYYQIVGWDNDNFGGMLLERTSGKIFHDGKTYESTLLLRPYKLSVRGHPTGREVTIENVHYTEFIDNGQLKYVQKHAADALLDAEGGQYVKFHTLKEVPEDINFSL